MTYHGKSATLFAIKVLNEIALSFQFARQHPPDRQPFYAVGRWPVYERFHLPLEAELSTSKTPT
jgi:hypothetical protein